MIRYIQSSEVWEVDDFTYFWPWFLVKIDLNVSFDKVVGQLQYTPMPLPGTVELQPSELMYGECYRQNTVFVAEAEVYQRRCGLEATQGLDWGLCFEAFPGYPQSFQPRESIMEDR
jgi:hypothetical protein